MLLRPRKFLFKNRQKDRSLKFFKNSRFSFGSGGLLLLQPLKLNSRQIFRYKLFFKRAYKRSDKTLRYAWFNLFPHLPITRKVKGSRMGKGKGKLAGWSSDVPSGVFLIEFKNLRPGRLLYFTTQFRYKLPVKSKVLFRNPTMIPLTISALSLIRFSSTW